MKFEKYITENNRDWHYYIDDDYATLDPKKKNEIFEVIKKFIYNLPMKYSNKKEVFAQMRKDKIRVPVKEVNDYIEGLDESRLEELVGIIWDYVKNQT